MTRKVAIDPRIYNPASLFESGGVDGCDHDFDPKPVDRTDWDSTWECTVCGRHVSYEKWEAE